MRKSKDVKEGGRENNHHSLCTPGCGPGLFVLTQCSANLNSVKVPHKRHS